VDQRLARAASVQRTNVVQNALLNALSKCEMALSEVRNAKCVSLGGIDMSFLNSSSLDELARRLADAVPESVRSFGRDLEGNFKAVLQAQLSKLDLVSRHEFDVQAALLARTQTALAALEARVKELEVRINPQ
jgi:BMFP domain-containing protein YqiC